MDFLFVGNIALAVALLFWPVWFSRSELNMPWLNPFTIALVVSLPVQLMKLFGGPLVLIDDGLFDNGYQYALLMGNLLTLAQTVGLVVFMRGCELFRIDRLLPLQRVLLGGRSLRRGALLFLLIFVVALVLLASAEFGILNWLANPREGYQLYRTGEGHWYAIAVSALSVSFLLAMLSRPQPRWIIKCAIIYLGLGYLLGSKGTLLAIFISALTFLWFLRWRHLPKVILIGTPVLMALLLFNLYQALSDGFELQSIFEYFDYYKNAADYYRGYLSGEIPLFLGKVSISSLWAYVPRVLWPHKPVVYGVLLVNEIFYPGQAELTNTPAFGGAVEQFADFGVPGVLFYGLFSVQSLTTAVLSYLIFRRPGVGFKSVSLATVMLLLIQYAPGFGLFFPGALYLVMLAIVVGLIRMVRTRRRSRRRAASAVALQGGSGMP